MFQRSLKFNHFCGHNYTTLRLFLLPLVSAKIRNCVYMVLVVVSPQDHFSGVLVEMHKLHDKW